MSSTAAIKALAVDASHRREVFPPEAIIFGGSAEMQVVRNAVEKVATTDVPVLIRGESGTGKEIIARLIHRRSSYSQGPFIKVNCAAIPGLLLESELFGYQRGAFTGAYTAKPGRIEMADHGTLFLDEIAELDAALQAKLLHVLQDGQFTRIGDYEERKANARVVCATNRRLENEIAARTFRQDLLYRINVITIHLPPLRDRRDDIPDLAEYFAALFSRRYERQALPLSREIKHALQQRDWAGNIRELENTMARYVLLGEEEILVRPLHEKRRSPPMEFRPAPDGSLPLKSISKGVVEETERQVILRALEANKWNRRRTADMLKISYRALLYKSRNAGLLPKPPS